MSNKEITITVAGVGNSGKTTLMRIIENALREHGITDITPVTLGDEPMPDDARIKEIIASGRLTPAVKIEERMIRQSYLSTSVTMKSLIDKLNEDFKESGALITLLIDSIDIDSLNYFRESFNNHGVRFDVALDEKTFDLRKFLLMKRVTAGAMKGIIVQPIMVDNLSQHDIGYSPKCTVEADVVLVGQSTNGVIEFSVSKYRGNINVLTNAWCRII